MTVFFPLKTKRETVPFSPLPGMMGRKIELPKSPACHSVPQPGEGIFMITSPTQTTSARTSGIMDARIANASARERFMIDIILQSEAGVETNPRLHQLHARSK